MKIVCTAFVAIIVFTSCSTDLAEPASVRLPDDPEELQALLAEQPNEKTRLEILYALYQSSRMADPDQAYAYLDQQRLLALRLGDELTGGKACYNMGLLRKQQGNYIQAVEWYLKAVNHFERIEDAMRIGVVLDNIGVIFMETGNYEYARRFYEKTRDIHLRSDDAQKQVISTLSIGVCSFSQEIPEYAEAEKYFSEAIRLAEGLQSKRGYYLNRIYNYLGAMSYKKGDFSGAKDYYLKSLEFIDPTENENQVRFVAFSNIGEAEMGAGKFTEAHQWMGKALELIETADMNADLLISGYNIIGQLYQKEKRYAESIEPLEEAISIADKNVISGPLQETLGLIRQSYMELNKAGEAVGADKYDRILAMDAMQDRLEEKLVEKTNFKALQAALAMKIELDTEKKEKRAEMEAKMIFINIAVVLAVVAIFIGYRLRTTGAKLSQAGNKMKLIREAVKDL